MRFAVTALALAALAPLLPPPTPAQGQVVVESYRALYDRGAELEARAARAPAGEQRLRYYRAAAPLFERALLLRAREAAADYTIFNALGTVYLGAGDLVRADLHLQQGLANERSLAPADRGRLYATLGYLNALRGDDVVARRYYALSARLGNATALQSLGQLQRARTQ